MYLPPPHREHDTARMIALMRAHPLGLLITHAADGLTANAAPFSVCEEGGVLRLVAHLARANPQWRQAGEALVVFTGPDAYVSPGWYATKQTTGAVVPTWNYVAVHAYGRLRAIEDRAWLRAQVEALTTTHEAARAGPWRVDDAPPAYIEQMLGAIVGVEIAVARLEGKWKMSQNRTVEDRIGVVAGLRAQSGAETDAVAALVDATIGPERAR